MKTFYFFLFMGMALSNTSSQLRVQMSTAVQPQIAVVPDLFVIDMPENTMSVYVANAITFSETSDDKKKDPGYTIYKEAYNLILDEKWEGARKKFSEMVKQFPKSEYVDDAKYWSAFALKHYDRSRAIDAYKQFIREYPHSTYYDDAVADASDFDMQVLITMSGVDSLAYFIDSGRVRGFSYKYIPTQEPPTTQDIERMEHSLKRRMKQQERLFSRMNIKPMARWQGISKPGLTTTVPSSLFPVLAPDGLRSDEKLDPETRLKMDALYALGETKEDSMSFQTLRDVVVNPNQPRQLRDAAMDVLSSFKKFDVLPVYLEVAKKDTSEEIQNAAIEYMGQLSNNKNRSIETLSELFYVIPKHRVRQQQTVLWSIGEIGNDKAVHFLSKVARTHENYDLRSDAVHCLGTIGSEQARAALYEILEGK